MSDSELTRPATSDKPRSSAEIARDIIDKYVSFEDIGPCHALIVTDEAALADEFTQAVESEREKLKTAVEALRFYASCPPESGIREGEICGEFIGLGQRAREALKKIGAS